MTECNKLFLHNIQYNHCDFGIKLNKQNTFQQSINTIMKSYIVARIKIIILVNKTVSKLLFAILYETSLK